MSDESAVPAVPAGGETPVVPAVGETHVVPAVPAVRAAGETPAVTAAGETPAVPAVPAATAATTRARRVPPAPVAPAPVVDEPSEDVVTGVADTALPGEHRGGFHRPFTEPLPVTAPVHTSVEWAPAPAAPLPRSAAWALTFGILGLVVSLLVGWGFLIGLVGAALAIVALRRPWEHRGVALWGLCLSGLSLVYSAGWLWWASTQGPLFG